MKRERKARRKWNNGRRIRRAEKAINIIHRPEELRVHFKFIRTT
jgi:hypothetical protein